ncbi:Somatostatin receptor type 5 [Branchiostoma belcheri]|nr:Somatostatin receptor type 5 [Branchiostoma belcheri]
MDNATAGNWSFPNGTDGFYVPPPDAVTAIVGPTVYGLVTAVGLVGNLLVIYTLLGHTKMQDATNYYILNLALADTLFMLGIPFISASSAMERWVFGRAMCKIVLSMDALNMFNSVFNVAVLSVDRYLAIVCAASHPHLRRPRVAVAVSLSVWAAGLLLTVPVMTVSDTVPMGDGNDMCMLDWPAENALVCASYLLVVRHLKQRVPANNAAVAEASNRVRTKVTQTVFALIVTFVICWLPFHVCQLVNLAADLQPTPVIAAVFHVAMVMSYGNSCANPVLYVFTSQKFRQSLRAALRLTPRDHAAERASYYLHTRDQDAARRRRDRDVFFQEENQGELHRLWRDYVGIRPRYFIFATSGAWQRLLLAYSTARN